MQSTPDLADLQRAVASNPGNAQLLYLLGAELAQRGDYEDAVSAFTSAVAIDPSLHTARFQLGLLHLTMAQPERSMAVLGALEELDDDHPLKHFKRGLQALARDDFDGCIASLQRGIGLNSANPALNNDMSMIIDRINQARAENAGAAHRDLGETPREAPKPPPDLTLYKEIEDT